MDIQKLVTENQGLLDKWWDFLLSFWPKLLGAIAILYIGFKVIHIIEWFIEKAFKRAKLDPMLEGFIESIVSILLKIFVVISAAGLVGVETSSFVAIIAAASLSVGMALSWTLQNFAGGVMILILKPYKIGDYISAAGYEGTVKQILIFNTILLTVDRQTVIIPNAEISNASMKNYSSEPMRRLDLDIGIDYSDSIDLAKETLQYIVDNTAKVINKEHATIAVKELGDNAVIITCRVFVRTADYWDVHFEMLENIKKTFDAKGLNFPFPQRQIHITKQEQSAPLETVQTSKNSNSTSASEED